MKRLAHDRVPVWQTVLFAVGSFVLAAWLAYKALPYEPEVRFGLGPWGAIDDPPTNWDLLLSTLGKFARRYQDVFEPHFHKIALVALVFISIFVTVCLFHTIRSLFVVRSIRTFPWWYLAQTVGSVACLIVALECFSGSFLHPGMSMMLRPVQLDGMLRAPVRAYVGTSSMITVVLQPPVFTNTVESLLPDGPSGEGERIKLAVPMDAKIAGLGVELLSAGVDVAGEKQQVKSLASDVALKYVWNCHFKDSGDYILTFTFRGVTESGPTVELANYPRRLRVVRIDDLTDGQVWLASWLLGALGVLSTALAIVKAIREGVLKKSVTSEPIVTLK